MKERFRNHVHLVSGNAPINGDFQVALESMIGGTGGLDWDSPTEYEIGTPFEAGDVLFGKLRPYLAKVWLADRSGYAVGDIHVYRPRLGVVPNYLKYVVLDREFIRRVDSGTYGAKMPRADWGDIREIEVQFPSHREQEAIADFLDRETAQIDAMIEAQQALVEQLHERRGAAISDIMDGDSSLPRVPLRRLIRGISQGWSPQCEDTPVVDPANEWAVLKVGCVNGGFFRPEQNKMLPSDIEPRPELALRAGDLLISRGNTRELVGSAAVVDKDYPTLMLSDLIYRVTLDDSLIDSAYVALTLSTRMARDEIEMSAKGASHSMQKISQRDIRSITIPLRSRQAQAFVVAEAKEVSARADTLISAAQRVIEFLRERREALMTAAITGRIDPKTGIERIDPTTEKEAW